MRLAQRHQVATDGGAPEPWDARAACKGLDPDLFFPTRANTPAAHIAARHCLTCPVRAECLQHAINEPRTDGIRGGHYFDEGRHRLVGEPDPYRSGGSDRSQLAAERRHAALGQFHQIRPEHHSDAEAYRALAAHYGVTEGCAREWIRTARAELRRKVAADRRGTDNGQARNDDTNEAAQ